MKLLEIINSEFPQSDEVRGNEKDPKRSKKLRRKWKYAKNQRTPIEDKVQGRASNDPKPGQGLGNGPYK